jgi:hypothetical protein
MGKKKRILQKDFAMDVSTLPFSFEHPFGYSYEFSCSFYLRFNHCETGLCLTLTLHDVNLEHRVVFPWAAGAAHGNAALFIGPLHFPHKEAAMDVAIPCPDRIRHIPAHFAWIDRRLRDKRFLGTLTLQELAVYVFLILAANKHGVSFYRSEQIAELFDYQIQPFDVIQCRNDLFDKELIAFLPFKGRSNEGFCQVLPMPLSVTVITPQKRGGDVTTVKDIIRSMNGNLFYGR